MIIPLDIHPRRNQSPVVMPSAKSHKITSSSSTPSIAAVETGATLADITQSLDGLSAGNGDGANRAVSASAEEAAVAPQRQQHQQEVASLEDPLCSARTAQKVTFQDVTTASFLIKGGVEYTPCPVSGAIRTTIKCIIIGLI